MKKTKLDLFLSFFRIGLFTFGGGYAMIALIEREFVEKKKYLDSKEFLDMIAIAESTPGPIAINMATYIGYKTKKLLGAIVASLAVCLPSFVIIYLVSLFFDQFISLTYVGYAFKGIQACVIYLIFSAGIKMIKSVDKNLINIILCIITMSLIIIFTLFSISFSSIFYILIAALIGFILYLIEKYKMKEKGEKV